MPSNTSEIAWVQRVLADTGLFVALFNRNDRYHQRSVDFLKHSPQLLTSWLVVTEVGFFLDVRGKLAYLEFIRRGGVAVMDIAIADLHGVGAVLKKYQDREVDLADASLIWLAEKLDITDIATVDRRDFEIYRLSGNRQFSLVL